MIHIRNMETGKQINAGCLLTSEDTVFTEKEIKFSFNLKCSQLEANAVRTFLMSLAVPPSDFQKRPPYAELIQPEGPAVEALTVRGVLRDVKFVPVDMSIKTRVFYRVYCEFFRLDPQKYGAL